MRSMIYAGIFALALAAASLWAGTRLGRYSASLEREAAYPHHLQRSAAGHMPTCDELRALEDAPEPFSFSVIRDEAGEPLGRLISLVENQDGGQIVISIFDRQQNQFIEEVWPECGG
jgi:hypothetical protein